MIAGLPRSIRLFTLAFGVVALSGTWSAAQVRSAHVMLDRDGLSRARAMGARATATPDSATGFSVVEAPFPFSAVAVLADPSSDGDLTVRASADGREWSSPVLVPDDDPNPPLNERGQAHRFALDRVSSLYFPKSLANSHPRFLAFEFVNAKNPPTRVALHFIDAGASPESPARSRATASGPGAAGDEKGGHPLKPALVSRAAWGARPPKYEYSFTLAKHLAIHHTAGVSDGLAATTEECAAQVRAIQAFHQDTRDWNDVGYSYLICATGEVFQAREDDDDTTDVWGAHDGFNRGSMSVSLMGYFHPPYDQVPSAPMLDALVRTLAWMADIRAVDPLDESLYEAFGSVRTNIYGHREVRATECPGNALFAMKDSLRIAVAATLEQYRNPIPPAASRR